MSLHNHLLIRDTFRRTKPFPPLWFKTGNADSADEVETAQVHAGLYLVGPRKTALEALLSSVRQARELILVASFLLSHQTLVAALLEAAKRGVRVYILTSAEANLDKLIDDEDSLDQRLQDAQRAMLATLAPHVTLRSAAHLHAKFMLVDPHLVGASSSACAWLSTANFNRALEDGFELLLRIDDSEIATLQAWFNWAFWNEAERELTREQRLSVVSAPPAPVPAPPKTRLITTSKGRLDLKQACLQLIEGAQKYLFVSSYGLELTHETVQALLHKARMGVKVVLFTRPRPASKDALIALSHAGVRIMGHPKLHAKFLLSENGSLVMTANLAAHGLDSGFEAGIWVSETKNQALRALVREWLGSFPWEFKSNVPANETPGEALAPDRGFRDPLIPYGGSTTIRLPPLRLECALTLYEDAKPSQYCLRDSERELLHSEITYERELLAPRLPPDVRPATGLGDFSLPVFEKKGQRFIVIADETQLPMARALKFALPQSTVVLAP